MAEFIILSEKEAALRQLETTIKLYFNAQDNVSIHTLANTAHELLAKICKKQGIRAFIGDVELEMIRPEKKDEYIKIMSKARNFFKHGQDRNDKEESLKFYYEPTEFIIWDACRLYELINVDIPLTMMIFIAWFFSKYPNVIKDSEIKKAMGVFKQDLKLSNKREFIKSMPVNYKKHLRLAPDYF